MHYTMRFVNYYQTFIQIPNCNYTQNTNKEILRQCVFIKAAIYSYSDKQSE